MAQISRGRPAPADAIFISARQVETAVRELMVAIATVRPELDLLLIESDRLSKEFRGSYPLPIAVVNYRLLHDHPDYISILDRILIERDRTDYLLVSTTDSVQILPAPGRRIINASDWKDAPPNKLVKQLVAEISIAGDHAHVGDIYPLVPFKPVHLTKVDELGLSPRLARALASDNIVYIGDAAQRTVDQLLMLDGMSRGVLQELHDVLASLGLQYGIEIAGWPPENIEDAFERFDAVKRVRTLEQSHAGATFEAQGDRLAINPAGDDSDIAAAERPVTQQLHAEAKRKADRFSELAQRLDNQPAWKPLHPLATQICQLLDRPTEQIPQLLGSLYGGALELGSFLDMDQGLRAGEPSFVEALDAEMRRPLEDLVRTLAPWLRAFPTVRHMDDDTGKFLTRQIELSAARNVIQSAAEVELIDRPDAKAVIALADAGKHDGFQAEKARTRSAQSARNLVVKSLEILGAVIVGGIGSDYALHSTLAQKAGAFLASGEQEILVLVESLPHDLRLSIELIIRESQALGDAIPGQPPKPKPARSEPKARPD